MLKKYLIVPAAAFVLLLGACKSNTANTEIAEEKVQEGRTPVTITNPIKGNMNEIAIVNAVSAFQLKTNVKSSANGYLQDVAISLGKYVNKGDVLFVVKTKEAQSLGNTLHQLDSSLHFNGVITIKSPGTGFISQLNYRAGDYVQDGEQIATITDTKSFVFLLDLPYELTPYLHNNQSLQLHLPDGSILNGDVSNALPTVDPVSQTQNFVIRVNTSKQIPENLIAKVYLVKKAMSNTISVLKSAVLSDEVQSEFWIMQLIDSATAVKVPIKKGIENATNIEILSPALKLTDKILLTGNYGLPDTAKVIINQ
ncbi:MAG: HlyD family efflux transporter periplasmic adaptor subunit [Sediminibacterium sp.]|nr:MAG: HlyD family efflux transporter periplasmic adaptor subunit [Sediminibacterium sp.]